MIKNRRNIDNFHTIFIYFSSQNPEELYADKRIVDKCRYIFFKFALNLNGVQ